MSVTWLLAWRNLWRHSRRTWLTVGAMVFCNILLVFLISLQLGSYQMMIDGSLSAYTGHIQIQHRDFLEEQRMRQSGHWKGRRQLTPESFKQLLSQAIDNLVVDQARKEVEAFIRDPKSLAIWSQEFFQDIADRIQPV